MNKFLALIFTVGFIVITSLADFSTKQFHEPAESPVVEIVVDSEKTELEKSDEAIKVFCEAATENFDYMSHFDLNVHYTQEYLQRLLKPPKTLLFS